MKQFFKRFLIKSKLYTPIGIAITLSILIITIQAIYNLKRSIYSSIEDDLSAQIETVLKIFDHERTINLKNLNTYLEITENYLNSNSVFTGKDSVQVVVFDQNSKSTQTVWKKKWVIHGQPFDGNHEYVDKIYKQTNCYASIYQKNKIGYFCISTNILNKENKRETNTILPIHSEIAQKLEKGEKYTGRITIDGNVYLAGYMPIIADGKHVGLIRIDSKELDLPEFKKIINQIKIGKSGMLFVFDELGNIILNPEHEGENWSNDEKIKYILKNKNGIARLKDQKSGKGQIMAFNYSMDYKLYIAATVFEKDETQDLIKDIVYQSVIYGSIIFILLSLFIYFITTERLHTYFKQLEISNRKLSTTREALEQSEKKFRTLFNNSSDEVFVADFQGKFVEVNEVACNTLEYTREELLKMRFFDIKTKKYMPYVSENIKKIIEKGYYTFETEHVTKSGKVFPFEVKSRVIEYEGRQLIMSITRNIYDRKAIEKQIVQTIIETELHERKRFSADLHDGLGPVLSAIRLYSDLIKRGNFKNMSLSEAVGNIDELVDMAIANTKEISNNITPNVLEDFGLSVAIQEFCSYISRTKSIEIDLDINNFTITKSGLETTILYQSVKELINNTLKHAQAKNIRIELKNQHNQILLYYRDDGIGFNMEEKLNASSGLGLRNIINKIKTLKGNCDFNSIEGKGMFVLVSLNLENGEG